MQPSYLPGAVNLADLYRLAGREEEGERVLRQAIAREPDLADAHHALRLLLVRRGQREEALAELGRAAELAPRAPLYTYVHALALYDSGRRQEARARLAEAQRRFTGDRAILAALAEFAAEAGDREAAARWAQTLRGLEAG